MFSIDHPALLSCAATGYCGVVTTALPKNTATSGVTSSLPSSSTTLQASSSTTVKVSETTTAAPSTVTELPEELTTIIEIEEPEGNSTDSVDFVNLPGYGVVDDVNSTANASVFSCYNRRYGYYADIAKKCYMFHLCYPVQEPTTGQLIFQRFSFVCSDNAVFDQQHLVCVDNETLSYSCSESHKYFVESNNKLIESMQQNVQQSGYVQGAQQQPGLPEAAETNPVMAAALEAAQADESGASESSGVPVNVTAESDAEVAAQYALLEQMFG